MAHDYLTIAEAAEYIGVSQATLRRWDSSGKLQAVRRPGSSYRFYPVELLEPFRLEYLTAQGSSDTIGGFFKGADPSIPRNGLLREPQREAFEAAVAHFANTDEPAIIQLPVGCGKTGVAALLPFGLSTGRVLIVAPNTTIREGLYADLNISNAGCFWKKAGVLRDFSDGPFAALVDGPKANLDDCRRSHVVVANIQQLASRADRWLSQFPPDFFDLVIIDEGHHVAAESWQRVVRAFPNARIISLTATPFRGDNRELLGDLIYSYSFTRAMINGYIKHIFAAHAQPSEITFNVAGDQRTYSLDEILELREEAWFRRGVALSEDCNRHIAEKAVEKMWGLRQATGFQHQIIASAMSIDHARQIKAIFQELGLQAAEIHSQMDDDRKAAIFAKLRNGQLDCIAQVTMLGEGFDHPPLSVAAIFRPFRTLSPYIQFIGRIMRVIDHNDASHPNNTGYVVSHAGLNNEERWEDFRELDKQDRELVQSWLSEERASPVSNSRSDAGQRSMRFDEDLVADQEVVSFFATQGFLDPDDNSVLETMLDAKGPGGFTYRELGVDPELLRQMFADRRVAQEAPADSVPVQPQVRRQTVRSRLDGRSKSVHNRILNDLGIARAGFDVARAVKGARGNNADALFAIMNEAINQFVGQPSGTREKWSLEQMQLAYENLDVVGDQVSTKLRAAMEQGRG